MSNNRKDPPNEIPTNKRPLKSPPIEDPALPDDDHSIDPQMPRM